MDASHLERRAAELRELAGQAREAAATAVATDGVEWRSVAADRFRESLHREAEFARRCADLLDDAAQAMAVHARSVPALPVQASR